MFGGKKLSQHMPTYDFGLFKFLNLEVKNKSGSLQWFEWEQKGSPDLGQSSWMDRTKNF